MISKLHLKNFAAFTEISLEFSRGINIVIGENGTGKTQLLKAILALCGPETHGERAGEELARRMCRLYLPLSEQVGELRRAGDGKDAVLTAIDALDRETTIRFAGNATTVKVSASATTELATAVFIPTKEVLSLVRGLTSPQADQHTIERIFDDGYLTLANLLRKDDDGSLQKKAQSNPRYSQIVPTLTNLIGGTLCVEGRRLLFSSGHLPRPSGRKCR
jgi:energy-coupling factor transporter ATP-binding protein EcfA2